MKTKPRTKASGLVRRRAVCGLYLAMTLPLGLLWRLAPLHLPPFAYKYGGSALWAIAVYWLVALLKPGWRAEQLALTACCLALAVELFKLVRSPLLDTFRDTLAGKLLIGRYFTPGAIAAYWMAIGAVAVLDAWQQADRQRSI